MTIEIWKSVKNYENSYEVSNLGRVKSLDRRLKGKILKQADNGKGYLVVCLSQYGKQKTVGVHRLVASAFVSGYFENAQVNHLDENTYNNNAVNLEWCTQRENLSYGTRVNRMAKSRSKSVKGINLYTGEEITFTKIKDADEYGFSHSHISKCAKGKLKSHKGFRWQYI